MLMVISRHSTFISYPQPSMTGDTLLTIMLSIVSKMPYSPGQLGSVGWSVIPELKGCWFDSGSVHMP